MSVSTLCFRAALLIAITGLVSSTIYLFLNIAGGVYFRRNRNDSAGIFPPISVLKPVHGYEEALQENVRSFFRQDYPEFELIFCARSLADPAIQYARKVAAEFPDVQARFIESGEPAWTNPKIYSMYLLEQAARHDIVLFSDSDVRVTPAYLRSVVSPMNDPETGLVTCAFRGRAPRGFWSRLTALNQTVEFFSGVLTANLLEGMTFGLGPTLLLRKEHLRAIGGLASMHEHLADDFWIGNRTVQAGKKVVLSSCVVDHYLRPESLRKNFDHQLGWMKNTRCSRPAGHLGTGLTFAMPFACLGAIAAFAAGHARWGCLFLLAGLLNRWVQALSAIYFTRDAVQLRMFWLHPLSDLFGFAAWLLSYSGSVIDYRGEKYRLRKGGKIVRV